MRSKVTKKILVSTPDEIRESVREQVNDMVNSAHSYTEGAETTQPAIRISAVEVH